MPAIRMLVQCLHRTWFPARAYKHETACPRIAQEQATEQKEHPWGSTCEQVLSWYIVTFCDATMLRQHVLGDLILVVPAVQGLWWQVLVEVTALTALTSLQAWWAEIAPWSHLLQQLLAASCFQHEGFKNPVASWCDQSSMSDVGWSWLPWPNTLLGRVLI